MTSWEERMSIRAHERAQMAEALEREKRVAEELALQNEPAEDWVTYLGYCDSCGALLELRHSVSLQGIIDYGIDQNDNGQNSVYTWVTHSQGPLPGCKVYSSRVYAM